MDRTTTAHLRALLARLPNLKTLILGGKHSVGFDPGDWARLLAPMETPLASVERVVVEEGPKLGPLAEFPGLFPSLFPGLSFLVLKKGNGDDIIFSWAPKGKD